MDQNRSGAMVSGDCAGREHWVEHQGVRLYLWEKIQGDPAGKPIVVLAHGSATAGRESFDLQVPGKPGYSLMQVLAEAGFDVFAPDLRGFGRSTRPEGHMTTQQASEDLTAVVDYVLALRGARQVHLLGWSWGTQCGGMCVASQPQKVASFVSYAQMHVNSPDIATRRPKLEAFRKAPYVSIQEAGWKPRFFSMTPADANDPEVIDAFARAAVQAEPRTPTGPQIDMVTLLPLLHPRLLPVPTLVIHGQYDDVADVDGLFPFFQQLPHPNKCYAVIPDAGHMMHLQKGHQQFQQEVIHFFRAASR